MTIKNIEIDELKRLYLDEGLSQNEIAKIYGCERKTIGNWLKRHNIDVKPRGKSRLDCEDRLLELINSGMLVKEACVELNISRRTAHARLSELGISQRNSEAQRKRQSEFMRSNSPTKDKEVAKRAVTNARLARIANKEIYNSKFDEALTFKDYAKKARSIAYKTIGSCPKGYCIDHKYSIKDGYANKVPLSVISKNENLRIITEEENLKKGYNSIITLKELLS